MYIRANNEGLVKILVRGAARLMCWDLSDRLGMCIIYYKIVHEVQI